MVTCTGSTSAAAAGPASSRTVAASRDRQHGARQHGARQPQARYRRLPRAWGLAFARLDLTPAESTALGAMVLGLIVPVLLWLTGLAVVWLLWRPACSAFFRGRVSLARAAVS